jgi:hypothetical protein
MLRQVAAFVELRRSGQSDPRFFARGRTERGDSADGLLLVIGYM